MVTITGKLTNADRALLEKAQKHADAVNKRESDANFRGLASVLRAASTGSIVKSSGIKKTSVIKNASSIKKSSTIKRASGIKKSSII